MVKDDNVSFRRFGGSASAKTDLVRQLGLVLGGLDESNTRRHVFFVAEIVGTARVGGMGRTTKKRRFWTYSERRLAAGD
jgi:hypothetical protein